MKAGSIFCCIQEAHLNNKDIHHLRIKGLTHIFHANKPNKQADITIIIYIKIDFHSKLIQCDREGQYILIKGKKIPQRLCVKYEYIYIENKSIHIRKRNLT